jgi:hypothetical protein
MTLQCQTLLVSVDQTLLRLRGNAEKNESQNDCALSHMDLELRIPAV